MLAAGISELNGSELIFPALEVIHIVGGTMLVGTIAIVDFHLLGLGLPGQNLSTLAQSLSIWTLVGLVLILFSGPLMFASDPDMYYLNLAFQAKMVFFALALIFHYTVHRRVAAGGSSVLGNAAVGAISLTLWVGTIFGGIFIGFV